MPVALSVNARLAKAGVLRPLLAQPPCLGGEMHLSCEMHLSRESAWPVTSLHSVPWGVAAFGLGRLPLSCSVSFERLVRVVGLDPLWR